MSLIFAVFIWQLYWNLTSNGKFLYLYTTLGPICVMHKSQRHYTPFSRIIAPSDLRHSTMSRKLVRVSGFRIQHSLRNLFEASGFANPKNSFSSHQQTKNKMNYLNNHMPFTNPETRNESRTSSSFAIASCNICPTHQSNPETRNECRTGSGFAISTFNLGT